MIVQRTKRQTEQVSTLGLSVLERWRMCRGRQRRRYRHHRSVAYTHRGSRQPGHYQRLHLLLRSDSWVVLERGTL